MKLFYAMMITVQLLLAILSRDKNKIAYMLLVLWENYLDSGIQLPNNSMDSIGTFEIRETKFEANNDDYTLLLER